MLNRVSFFALLAISVSAWGFVPDAGQVIRYQSQMLRTSKAFAARGSVQIGKAKMETLLEWQAPTQYRFLIRDVSSSIYANGDNSSTWVLMRSGKRCVLKTDALTVTCPAPAFWAMMELSGQGEETANSLVAAGFLSEDAATFRETDVHNIPAKYAATRPALGANGKIPMAVIEIRGPSYQEPTDKKEAGYPVLQFDQTFLSPLLARFTQEGQLTSIKALSDLTMGPKKNRASKILASRIEVTNVNATTTFLRQESVPLTTRVDLTLPKALGDISALRDQLSVEGQEFLRALFLTH